MNEVYLCETKQIPIVDKNTMLENSWALQNFLVKMTADMFTMFIDK